MKFKRFTLLTLPVLITIVGAIALTDSKESRYFPRDLSEYNPTSAQGFLDYIAKVKANKTTGDVDPADVFAGRKQADLLPKSKASLNMNWTSLGPDNIGGRTRALIIDKNNPDHILAGAVAGGVFESFNGARSWQPYDSTYSVANISTITQGVDGSFYVGTGGHFETGAGTFNSRKGYFFVGSGVHKLTGNGNYDLLIGPSNRMDPSTDYATVGKIVASPVDNNKLYVAMNTGFRILQIDPNNGTVTETDPIGLSRKCNDIEVSMDGKVLVAYHGKIYVSQAGDSSFVETTPSSNFNFGRIECDIAPSNSQIMYAGAATSGGCLAGIYRSQDGGLNWESIAPGGTSAADMYANPGVNCQGGWDNTVEVFPDDPGKLIVGGVTLHRWVQSSTDPAPSNGSWDQLDVLFDFDPSGNEIPFYVHADKHNVAFDPRNSSVAYIASDGGITKSVDFNNPLPTYQVHNYKYGVTQYYGIAVNPNGVVIGGSQDNGSHVINLRNNANLAGYDVLGGDGFDAEMSTIDPSLGFASIYNNTIRRIQGIGTTIGNSNFSTADIVSNNAFMGGVCISPQGCSNVFYTATTFWESFNHEGSTDSVEIVYERTELPPIPQGTKVNFESNNNDIPQEDSLRADLHPLDTISAASGRFDTLFLVNDTTGVFNFDTINVDFTNGVITVGRRADTASLNLNFNIGAEVNYVNLLLNRDSLVSLFVDTFKFGPETGEPYLLVEDLNITFRYLFKVQDRVQSIYASANWPGIGGSGVNYNENNVFITRDLLKGESNIKWYHIAGAQSTPDPIQGEVLDMKFSTDGNHLFVGTTSGFLYRISNIDTIGSHLNASETSNLYSIVNNEMSGECYEIGRFAGRSVTAIDVDPNNSDNVVVALGNYGHQSYVARTTIATTATNSTGTFEFIQGVGNNALPAVPAYAILIDKNNDNNVLIGTELGLFGTDNAFTTNNADVSWTEENAGMGRVPVFDIKQMRFDYTRASNHGRVYIGTHGRGVFVSDVLVGLNENSELEAKKEFKNSMKIYPNPVYQNATIEFKVEDISSAVLVEVYNIAGQKVREERLTQLSKGKNSLRLNMSALDRGTYILRAVHKDQIYSTKFIKQ